jgi:hypothetical protein
MFTGCTEDGPGTVTLNLTVNDFTPGETAAPVPNAEVCVLDTEDCTTTDADGLAVVMLPANAETALAITAAGHDRTLLAQTTDANFASDQTTTLLSETIATALAALLDIDYPLVGTGVIGVTTLFSAEGGGGIPGTTLELTDGTGTGYYITEDGIPTYELTATSSFGGGGFVEVTPGVVEIDIGGSGGCGVAQAWPGSTATSIRLPVEAGSVTFSFVFCETVGVDVTVSGAEEPFGDLVPLEGAEVCEDGTDNCATTNVDGEATLQIPGNLEFAYAVTPPSAFFPSLIPQVSDSDIPPSPNFTVLSEDTLMGFAALLNTEFPPTTGTIGLVVYENPFPELVGIPGVSFELIEGTGRLYYLNDSNLPTTMLTETVDNGSGGFVEASEGTLEIGLSGVQNCERPYSAWPGSEANQFRVPSRVGFLTLPAIWCDAE